MFWRGLTSIEAPPNDRGGVQPVRQLVDTPEKPDPNTARATQQAAKAFHTNGD